MTRKIKITATQLPAGNFRIDIKGKFSQRDLVLVANAIIRSIVKTAPIEAGQMASTLLQHLSQVTTAGKNEQQD